MKMVIESPGNCLKLKMISLEESLCVYIEQKELSLKIDMYWILQVHVQLCIYYCTVYVVVGETEAAGFQRGINAPSHPLNEILETIKYWR